VNRRDLLLTVARAAAVAGAVSSLPSIGSAPSRVTRTPSADTPAGATEITRGPVDRPNVALTFHGQGSADVVDPLLRILEAKKAQVTVLAVGSWLAAAPAMAGKILDGGHELGNHTQRHLALAQLSVTEMKDEIAACATELKDLTGTIGTWFRPSQIHHATSLIRQVAADVGYPTCLSYDVDSLDYTDPGPAAITRTVLEAAHNGAIVSLHFGHPGTVAALPTIIDGLRRADLHPVTVTELVRS
jgi:peptidoglycan/xylan/chitin deacetylase (PgdA/CDA1 family)